MVEVPNSVHTVYTAEVTKRDGGYVVEVPDRELDLGSVDKGETVRVALLEAEEAVSEDEADGRQMVDESSGPPVSEGETLEVTIESVGDQGDGIAKVDRGYVLIVPGAAPGEQPKIRVEEVRKNVGFAEVID
ncbi:TRAM domain-containing protein [Halobellus rubicundus]|uniref:TRAM domain-containing protein n=1 Tax=Halobellus rubicundus TaxID=2996466 RepID=A0ABD5M7Z8_9EURY